MADALEDNRWISNLKANPSDAILQQFVWLYQKLQHIELNPHSDDSVTWKMSASGTYSASSAYHIQFTGSIHSPLENLVWKPQIPMKCKFFNWVALHGKCLTAENLAKRGWPHNPICSLCWTSNETADHLLLHCSFSAEFWRRILINFNLPLPSVLVPDCSLLSWRLASLDAIPNSAREKWNILQMLHSWFTWKERNNRVFNAKACSIDDLLQSLSEELHLWRSAGLKATKLVDPQ